VRLIGTLAISALTLGCVLNGVYLIKLSSRIDRLSTATVGFDQRPSDSRQPLPARLPAPLARTAHSPAALSPAPSAPPATVLGDALHTLEGRRHLEDALTALEEDARRAELAERVAGDERRQEKNRERLTRMFALGGAEQQKIASIHAAARSERQRIVEAMLAGAKTASEGEAALDAVRENASQQVRTALGEQRVRRLRELQNPQPRLDRQTVAERSNAPLSPALAADSTGFTPP
jgi:hypothetical protein